MSPTDPSFDSLKRKILNGTPGELANFFSQLNEKERKALSAPCYKLHRKLQNGSIVAKGKYAYQNSPLAVVGACPFAKAKRVEIWSLGPYHTESRNALLRLLLDRNPKWISKWVEVQLEREWGLSWEVIIGLVEADVPIDLLTDNCARNFGNRFNNTTMTLSKELMEREYLQAIIPRLFEVETSAFLLPDDVFFGRTEKYESWGTALQKLTSLGVIQRSDLLDWSLQGLLRDFPQNQLSAMAKLHSKLTPSREECQEREALYCELLASPHSRVVNFSLKLLKKITPLNGPQFLKAALPALNLPTKGSAINIMKLLEKLPFTEGQDRELGLEVLRRASRHSHKDVVEYARDLSKRLAPKLGETASVVGTEQVVAESTAQLGALSLEGINSRWIDFLELKGEDVPGEWSCSLGQIPYRCQRLEPINDLQELVDRTAKAVEACDKGSEIELLLDAISRFADQRPPDFELRTQALKKRILDYPIGDSIGGIVGGWGGVSWELRHLLVSWLEGEYIAPSLLDYVKNTGAYEFFRLRLTEISQRVAKGVAAPLLARPTHVGGWLDPQALVQRARQVKLSEHRADLIAALLRIPPGGRVLALEQASQLPGAEGRAIRWALGADCAPPKGAKPQAVWRAAKECRSPSEVLPQPEFTEKGTIRWTKLPSAPSKPSRLKTFLGGLLGMDVLAPAWNPTETCYDLGVLDWGTTDNRASWIIDWTSTLWPVNLTHHWMQAINCIQFRIDDGASRSYPNHSFLEPLFESDRPWTEYSTLALGLALASKDEDLKGMAVDALIEGIEDGRAHPRHLARVWKPLYERRSLKLNRLAGSLLEASRSSFVARVLISETLQTLMVPPFPKNIHHLFDVLVETSTTLNPNLRLALEALRGSSKTTKLGKKLLTLPPTEEPNAVLGEALRKSRERRARDWSLPMDTDCQQIFTNT